MQAVSAILEELNNKSFTKALELSNELLDTPEKYMLKCLALAALGKTYSANNVVKDKISLPSSARLFAEMILQGHIDSNLLYEKAAEDSLGYLMWLVLEAQKMITGQAADEFWERKLTLLQPSKGLSEQDRLLLYRELVLHDNSLSANLRYAYATLLGSKVPPGQPIFQFIQQTLDRVMDVEKENVVNPFELIMDAVTIVMKINPVDSKLAKKFLVKAFKTDPSKKSVLMAAYLDLYGLAKGKQRLSLLVYAAQFSIDVEELATVHEASPEGQLQRLLDYLIAMNDKPFYSKNDIFQMAGKIFSRQEPAEQVSILTSLGRNNDLQQGKIWEFMGYLFGLFIKDDVHQKSSSFYLLAKEWVLSSEQLNRLLTQLAEQHQAHYVVSLLSKYASSPFFDKDDSTIIMKDSSSPFMYNRMYLMSHRGEPKAEPVLIGTAIPNSVQKGQEFTARFVAYSESVEAELEKKIYQLSPKATRHMGLKRFYWQKGTKVTVQLYGQWLSVEEPTVTFVWYDDTEMLDFDVRVDPNAPDSTTILKFDVLIDGLRVGTIRADLEINSSNIKGEPKFVTGPTIQTVFASYSSKDRARVLDRVAEIRRNGMDVFLDVITMVPGVDWQNILEKEIRQRDGFYLFWSVNAIKSEMVDWEWRTALKFKGIEGIDPHPLDPVADAPPPEELKDLHFGDVYVLARKATQSP